MGNSETKVEYETIDKTDPQSREKGRQEAIAKNAELVRRMEEELEEQREREMTSAMDEVRIQNIRDANAIAQEKKRKEEEKAERKRDEEYRKDMLALAKMKSEITEYEFGKKLARNTFEGIDISDMKRVVIALFGPTGSGKTSFIGTVERTLLGADKQTAFDQGTGSEGTVILSEFLASLKVNLLDTRGFFHVNESLLTELLNVMTGKTRLEEVMNRDDDGNQLSIEGNAVNASTRSMAKFTDRVHAVIFVMKANDTRLTGGQYLERMKKIRDHFRNEGYTPITIITCADEIKNSDQRDKAFEEASAATGSPIDRTFFISNYTSQNKDYSMDTEKQAVDILDTALMSAERFVKIQKLRDSNHGGGGDASIKEFFKQAASTYGWKNAERVAQVVEQLEKLEINTVESLKENWDDVKSEVKLTLGMKSGLEAALKKVS